MQNSLLRHPTGHFWVFFFRKNWYLSYRHIYLRHPLKLKVDWAIIILGDSISATPISGSVSLPSWRCWSTLVWLPHFHPIPSPFPRWVSLCWRSTIVLLDCVSVWWFALAFGLKIWLFHVRFLTPNRGLLLRGLCISILLRLHRRFILSDKSFVDCFFSGPGSGCYICCHVWVRPRVGWVYKCISSSHCRVLCVFDKDSCVAVVSTA